MDFSFFKLDRYFTVLNAANCICGNELDDGYNDLTQSTDIEGNKINIHFVEIKDIFSIMNLGPCFREVFIPEEFPIITEDFLNINGDSIKVCHIEKANLGPLNIWTPETIIELINAGADISAGDYFIVEWSLKYNFKIFYFLEEHICAQDENLWLQIIDKLYRKGLL